MAPSGTQLLVRLTASACIGALGASALNIDKHRIDPLLKAYRKLKEFDGGHDKRLHSVSHLAPECAVNHEADLHLPIAQVQARYPNKDMWCHFGFLGPWVHQCAAARKLKDYGHFYRTVSNGLKVIKSNRPRWRIKFGKFDIETRDSWHPLDDALCVATGFYDIPRDEIFDWQAMNDRSYKYCSDLLADKKTQRWANMSMADFVVEEMRDHKTLAGERARVIRERKRISGIRKRKGRDEDASRVRAEVKPHRLKDLEEGMLQHEVTKCLLGTAACDMAYCAGRACLEEDGKIVYSPSEECPSLPVGRMEDVKNQSTRHPNN